MSQNILTIDMVNAEAQRIFENATPLARTVNKQYDASFAKEGAKIGANLRVRLPDRSLVTKGAALQAQDESQQYANVTITDQAHIGLNFTTAEMALSLDRFSDLILKPRISQLAAQVEADIAAYAVPSLFSSVGTPGTTPASTQVLLQGGQKLNETAAPKDSRFAAITPSANVGIIEAMKGFYNPTGTVSQQFKSGLVANGILGYDEINMSQGLTVHTCGSRSTSDTILVNGTISTQGAATISIDGGTTTATVTKGDVFTIAGVYAVNPQTRVSTGSLQQFVVTEANTASSGAWTDIKVSPPMYTSAHALATIDAFPQDGAAITFLGAASMSYPQNLIYHKDAIVLATADLIMPQGVDMASRMSHNGVSMRIVRQYDINNDRMPCRVDVLYGVSVIRPQLGVRLWG